MFIPFSPPCFISKNTPELRSKIISLGYYPSNVNRLLEKAPTLVAIGISRKNKYFYGEPYMYPVIKAFECEFNFIDCGIDEDLFLTVAASRIEISEGKCFIITDKAIQLNLLNGKVVAQRKF